MALTDLAIVRRSMTARLFSTCITIVTVAVAVALLLVILSLRDAGRKAFATGTGNMHLLASREPSQLESVLHSVFYTGAPQAYLLWDEWTAYQDSERAVPLEWAIPTVVGDNFRGMPVVGTTPEFFSAFQPEAGRPWTFGAGGAFDATFEVVLGSEAARTSGLKLGQRIYLTHGMTRATGQVQDIAPPEDDHEGHDHEGHDHAHHDHDHTGAHIHQDYAFEVVGILGPTGSAHDRALFVPIEGSWILHAQDRRESELGSDAPLAQESDLLPADRKVTGIFLRVPTRAGSNASAAISTVGEQLKRSSLGLRVAAPGEEVRNLFRIVSNIDQILVALAAAVLLSSGIAIMLALYNSMEQRRRQVAILRVLGASRARVFGLVLTESALIGMLGAAVGLALGALGTVIAASALRARVGLSISAAPALEWTVILLAGATLLAALAGVIPAVMAYRTSVSRSLRPAA